MKGSDAISESNLSLPIPESKHRNLLIWSHRLVLSGDKFNAMCIAVNFLLEKIPDSQVDSVELAYRDFRINLESGFTYFLMEPGYLEGQPYIGMDENAKVVKHDFLEEIPTALSKYPKPGTRFIETIDGLEVFIFDLHEMSAWIRFKNLQPWKNDSGNLDTANDFFDLLVVSLRNISNDFLLMLTKKKIETQNKDLETKQALIERNNLILTSLMETMTRFNQEEMQTMLTTMIEKLKILFPETGFGIILQGERQEIVDMAQFIDVEEDLQRESIRLVLENESPQKGEHLEFFTLRGVDRPMLGKLVVVDSAFDDESSRIIRLFLDQVASFIENKILIRELDRLANTDGLTQAYNRAFFDNEFKNCSENVRKYEELQFSVVVLDLNGLKRVNDDFGHAEGDRLIIKAARVLQTLSRKSDLVCRFGGDEFVVLCRSTNFEQCQVLVDRIREEESQTTLEFVDAKKKSHSIDLRFSVGIASTSEGIAPEELIKLADERMYADKEAFYTRVKKYR